MLLEPRSSTFLLVKMTGGQHSPLAMNAVYTTSLLPQSRSLTRGWPLAVNEMSAVRSMGEAKNKEKIVTHLPTGAQQDVTTPLSLIPIWSIATMRLLSPNALSSGRVCSTN